MISSKEKLYIGILIVILLVFVGVSLVGLQKKVEKNTASGVISGGTFLDPFLVSATSSDRGTTTSFKIAGAKKVTLFLGTVVTNGQVTYSAQVSDEPELGQTDDRYSTSTNFLVPSQTASGYTSFETIVASTTGTSTPSIELEKSIYQYLRIIIDRGDNAGENYEDGTSTIRALIEY